MGVRMGVGVFARMLGCVCTRREGVFVRVCVCVRVCVYVCVRVCVCSGLASCQQRSGVDGNE